MEVSRRVQGRTVTANDIKTIQSITPRLLIFAFFLALIKAHLSHFLCS